MSYHVAAGDTFDIPIGSIRNLKCTCKKFDICQTLTKVFSRLKKADVKIDGFYEVPKLKKTFFKVIPANTSDVKRKSKKHFNISASYLCHRYYLTVTVEYSPTCTNWKIESNLMFPLNVGYTNTLLCHYNHTTTIIRASAENDSRVFYILNFGDEQFERNVTKEFTLPTKRMKIQSKANITASIKLCAHGCKRCGKEKVFICYSTIPKSLKNGKASDRNTIVILCALGGLIFFIIFAMILWYIYNKRGKSCNSDNDQIRPRRNAKSLARLLMQKDYAEENDPTYEEIDECGHYDKPDVSLKDIDTVSKTPHGRLVEQR